jgi:cobalt/nickel transport system permease protein
MAVIPSGSWLPWAVHISDGVLRNPWLAGGFALAGLLTLVAAYRVRDEEIPRIALLSAAFFVSSLLHVRLGPTSVHLLLNGLVGVVLGRRAPLAILIGLGLQAALLGHGGFWTIGVNACVMALPALLAGWMFALLLRLPGMRMPGSAFLWMAGCLIGMTSVLGTLLLDALVLLWGGAGDWHQIVWLIFYAHLPIVAVEGVVLGFTVSFLARVKPEMLGIRNDTSSTRPWLEPNSRDVPGIVLPATDVTPCIARGDEGAPSSVTVHPPALLLAAMVLLLAAGPARAHRLDADFQVLPDRQVRIESWFDPDGVPKGAKVQVFRPGPELLVEGRLDDQGCFLFRYAQAEPLEVIVSASDGHRKAFPIARELLEPSTGSSRMDEEPQTSTTNTPLSVRDADALRRERFKDALIGIGFLLAVGAFFLSWRTAKRLQALQRVIEQLNRLDCPSKR